MTHQPAQQPTGMRAILEGLRGRGSQLEQLNRSNKELQDQVNALQQKVDLMTVQSEEREALMESMKAFLDTHDDVDVTSVSNYLSDINSLAEQLASDLAFRWQSPAVKTRMEHSNGSYKGMKAVLGSKLARALDECDIHVEASRSLLLYSFQCSLAIRVFELFQSRTFRTKSDDPIQQLAEKVREGEIQPVYGRWRSLTQRYLRMGDGSETEDEAMNRFSHAVCIDVYNTALIFGLGLPGEEYTKVTQDLQRPLDDIAKKTIQFAVLVTANVVSKDYELLAPVSGIFDPKFMDIPFPLSSQPEDDKVVCPISLGLAFVEKPGRQKATPQKKWVQTATVITENTIEEIKTLAATNNKKTKSPKQSTNGKSGSQLTSNQAP